jgi:quinol monooxygenase YgiN
MWAQLITLKVTPGKEQDVPALIDALHATEQEESGLLRTLVLRDQADPSTHHTLVLFESEEKARAREADPRRDDGLAAARALMASMLQGPPSFANLDVIHDA